MAAMPQGLLHRLMSGLNRPGMGDGLGMLGAYLMAAGSPSLDPGASGRYLAEGMSGFSNAMRQARQDEEMQKFRDLQMRSMEAGMADQEEQRRGREKARGLLHGDVLAPYTVSPERTEPGQIAGMPEAEWQAKNNPERGLLAGLPAQSRALIEGITAMDPMKGYETASQMIPQDIFETIQDPYGMGGAGQKNKLTGQITGYQAPDYKSPQAMQQEKDLIATRVAGARAAQTGGPKKLHSVEVGQNGELFNIYSDGSTEQATINGQPIKSGLYNPETKTAVTLATERAQTKAEREKNLPKVRASMRSLDDATDNVIKIIDDLIGSDGKGGKLSSVTTGFVGNAYGRIPGTPAYDAARSLDTIKANIAFDRLQEMRNNSPTGGALGNTSNVEIDFLASVRGNLDRLQSNEQTRSNLADIRNQLKRSKGNRHTAFNDEYGDVMQQSPGSQVPVTGGDAEIDALINDILGPP